jgi:hypothetical protein
LTNFIISSFTSVYTGVFWFGQQYPQNSLIYEKNSALAGFAKADSTFTSPPNNGWFTTLGTLASASASSSSSSSTSASEALSLLQIFGFLQQNSWVLAGSRPEYASVLGSRAQRPLLTASQAAIEATLRSKPFINFATTADSATGDYGILGTMESRYFVNFSSTSGIQGFNTNPYFTNLGSTITQDSQIDAILVEKLNALIADLAKLDKSAILTSSPSIEAILKFQLDASSVTAQMPYGAMFLDYIDQPGLKARVILHFGTDRRIAASSNFPSQGKRQMIQLTQLNQALMRAFGSSDARLRGSTITQGVRAFPDLQNTKLNLGFGSIIGGILYPFGVSFLLPIFVIILVKEKEDKM